MRCRGSFSKARKTGKSIEQLQQQPSPSCPGFLFFFKFFKKTPLAIYLPEMNVENADSDDNGNCHQDHGEEKIFA
jgi:hypothetical protein